MSDQTVEGKEPVLHLEDDEVAFDYIKSSSFGTFWAEGAIGGPIPSGMVHFALYSERAALPRRVVNKLDLETGKLLADVPEKTISRGSLVREMHCDVVMSPEAARRLGEWLVGTANAADQRDDDNAS